MRKVLLGIVAIAVVGTCWGAADAKTIKVSPGPDAQERLLASGVEGAGTTPEAWGAIMKSEMTKWGKVIRDAGIRED
jgi:tripartite-type tricarboxylate transporter receptor subunit TctC